MLTTAEGWSGMPSLREGGRDSGELGVKVKGYRWCDRQQTNGWLAMAQGKRKVSDGLGHECA